MTGVPGFSTGTWRGTCHLVNKRSHCLLN